jgi:hypothetical protein
MNNLFPPLGPDDVPETRIDGKHHVGCIISQRRAIVATRLLFPSDIADGGDCRAEHGREGESCRVCAENNLRWTERVRQVRTAMMEAFK